MCLRLFLLFGITTAAAGPTVSAVQAQANPATCSLPPPLICPPDPPPGPKTLTQMDEWIKGIDASIGSIASASETATWSASPGASASIDAYKDDLKDYRKRVADYRDKISPRGPMNEVIEAQPASSDPQ